MSLAHQLFGTCKKQKRSQVLKKTSFKMWKTGYPNTKQDVESLIHEAQSYQTTLKQNSDIITKNLLVLGSHESLGLNRVGQELTAVQYRLYLTPELANKIHEHLWYKIKVVVKEPCTASLLCVRPASICLAKNVVGEYFKITCLWSHPVRDDKINSPAKFQNFTISHFAIDSQQAWCCFLLDNGNK